MSPLETRLLEPEQLPLVERLFERAYGRARPAADWRWRYRDNPAGRSLLMGAFTGDGRLVGFAGGYAVRVVDARAGSPREVALIHAGDAMTDPDLRAIASGRGGGWLAAMRALLDVAGDHGYAGCYGVMAPRLRRIYNRYVGTRDLVPVTCWRAVTSDLAHGDGDHEVARLRRPAEVGAEFDRLLEAAATAPGTLARRDAAYVRWRHLERPDGRTRLRTARRAGELAGWAAFRCEGSRLVWGDLLVAPGQEGAAAALLHAELASYWRFRRPTEIEAWFPPGSQGPAELLRRLGFTAGPQKDGLEAVIRGCNARADEAGDGLYYTLADCDLF